MNSPQTKTDVPKARKRPARPDGASLVRTSNVQFFRITDWVRSQPRDQFITLKDATEQAVAHHKHAISESTMKAVFETLELPIPGSNRAPPPFAPTLRDFRELLQITLLMANRMGDTELESRLRTLEHATS